ncbi:MAG: Tn3 family transposase [Planctomycetaceae bacterium]|nr:Tn3 family transposase [Planctomycetaceae bacterium]
MTTIERTAYPRFKSSFTQDELEHFYQPTESDATFVENRATDETQQLAMMILLKAFQKLGYLPKLDDVPVSVGKYIAKRMQHPWPDQLHDLPRMTRSRYRQAIYTHLEIKAFRDGGQEAVEIIVRQATRTMSDPADLINVAIEQLIVERFELPAYRTLDELVNHIRYQAHQELYAQVTANLTKEQEAILDGLLVRDKSETRNGFTRLKALPAKASLKWVRQWDKHLERLEKIMDPQPFLDGLPSTKVEQFASQAYRMEISDIKGVRTKAKRYTLLLCLLSQMQVRTRDQLTTMYLKRMQKLHNNAKKRLRALHDKHRNMNEMMIDAFADVVQHTGETAKLPNEEKDTALGKRVRQTIQANGGTEKLQTECQMLQAYHSNNYLPLLPDCYRHHRAVPFRLTERLQIRSATQSKVLLQALEFIHEHRNKRKSHLPADISLSFTTPRWHTFIREKVDGEIVFKKHHLEVCIFSHVADGIRNGDLYVEGTEAYADYRTQLLPWVECQDILEGYCSAVNLPISASDFVETLRQKFTKLAKRVDKAQTEASDLYFDADGKPHLRKLTRLSDPEEAEKLEAIMKSRMTERHLLDVLHHVHHWVGYTRHFGPPSGSDSKMRDPLSRYLITVFGYGCNLGPAQTARHARGLATERVIGRLNAQHITTDKLDAAIRGVIDEYARFHLPFMWGSGKTAVADGTHFELYENNLLGERHIRYGGYGGIAYHHISDTYVALFSRFISCGVWEAVYILDGLLQNKSVLQPDTVHADTQGQSEAVFGLAHLLGIKLMPRMRNWNKVSMYRPDRNLTFEHIDSWFNRHVKWQLIEDHWLDMMQVILSIHKGKLLPSWLLQKLNTDSPKNKLYLAFRELGRVIRTMFLLEFVSDPQTRREVQAATSKIESYNDFSQWIMFGGDGILKSRDPVENEKIIKYKDLIANAIMLQNVVDMTDVLHKMAQEGHAVTTEVVATFSPYLREHIKRFGEYVIDLEAIPPPLQPDKPFLSPVTA